MKAVDIVSIPSKLGDVL